MQQPPCDFIAPLSSTSYSLRKACKFISCLCQLKVESLNTEADSNALAESLALGTAIGFRAYTNK